MNNAITSIPKDGTPITIYYSHGSVENVRWDGKYWEKIEDSDLKLTPRNIIGWHLS